ncbi:MAG: hypothetical protein R6W76_20180, partial [Caldilinea sp.]
QQFRTGQRIKEFKPAPKKPKRMCDVAGNDQAIRSLLADAPDKVEIAMTINRSIVEVGCDDNTHQGIINGAELIRQSKDASGEIIVMRR